MIHTLKKHKCRNHNRERNHLANFITHDIEIADSGQNHFNDSKIPTSSLKQMNLSIDTTTIYNANKVIKVLV